MKFVASVTISPGELRKLLDFWAESGEKRDPFAHIIISPITSSPTTLNMVRQLKESGRSEVYFDSGAYTVQQGKLSYETLFNRLKTLYLDNQWADWYVLPDHVPASTDSEKIVEYKVRDTISVGALFNAELPDNLQSKILPVVQGHNISQIQRCLESYLNMGASYIGFGSFATMGANGEVNRLTINSTKMLNNLYTACKDKAFRMSSTSKPKIHVFGITTPPTLYLLKQLGAASFDSLGWNKAANYGNIYLPFTPAKNVSHRTTWQVGITQVMLEELKAQTDHDCFFCRDFKKLQTDYMYRRLHNLAVLMDMVDHIHQSWVPYEFAQKHIPEWLKPILKIQTSLIKQNDKERFPFPY